MERPVLLLALACGVFFTLGCQDQQALAELEKLRAQADIEERNKVLVEKSIRCIDTQDFERLRTLWAADLSVHSLDAPEPFGREGTIEYIQTYYSAFPDNIHTIHNIIAEGDFVAVMLTNTATHQEDFMGIPVTGNAIDIAGMHLVKVVDSVVAEWWLLDDNLGLMQQLGMELQPAATEG